MLKALLALLLMGQTGGTVSVNMNQNQVVGGGTVSGTVAISAPAPAGGTVVTLWAGDEVRIPTSVTIPAGAKFTGFSVVTQPTSQPLYVRILASTASARQQTFLQVMPVAGDSASKSTTSSKSSGQTMYKQTEKITGPVYGGGVPYWYPYGYGYGYDPNAKPQQFDSDGYPMMQTRDNMENF